MLKYRLVRGVKSGGFRGIRGGSCTKIAITCSIFNLEAQNTDWSGASELCRGEGFRGIRGRSCTKLAIFRARSPKFCMVVTLD